MSDDAGVLTTAAGLTLPAEVLAMYDRLYPQLRAAADSLHALSFEGVDEEAEPILVPTVAPVEEDSTWTAPGSP